VTSSRALMHIARNTVRAGGRRSVLIAGLIAMAVALGVVGNVAIRNIRSVAIGSYAIEQWGGIVFTGGADVRVDWWGTGQPSPWFHTDRATRSQQSLERTAEVQRREVPRVARIIAATLPRGATTTTLVEGELPDQRTVVTTADTADPLVAPMFERVDHGPALRGNQVLMSESALHHFDGAIGETVTVSGLGRAEIIGRARDAGDWSRRVIVVAREREHVVGHDRQHVWLIGGVSRVQRTAVVADLSRRLADFGGWEDEQEGGEMVAVGGGVIEAADGPPPPSGDALGLAWRPGTVGAALLLIVIAIIASAAFTVDHRRRTRHSGLLGAAGASPSQAVRIAMWEALFIGTAAAVAGAVVGVAVAVAAQPAIERLLLRSIRGSGLDWLDPVLPAPFGVAAAVMAARRPARSAARVSLVTALYGRPPGSQSRRVCRSTVMVSAPVVLLVLVVAGYMSLLGTQTTSIVVVALASLAAGPLMALLARAAGRQRLLIRLALRSVARHRERTALIVGALTVITAVSTGNFLVLYAIEGLEGAFRMWGLLVGGGAVFSFIAATTALGATDTDPDIRTAVLVGAPPGFRRWFQGAQAGVQAAAAMLLGVAAGLVLLVIETGILRLLLEEAPGWEFVLLMLALVLAICVSGLAVALLVALLSRSMPARPLSRRIT
jgi:hypothetical protein